MTNKGCNSCIHYTCYVNPYCECCQNLSAYEPRKQYITTVGLTNHDDYARYVKGLLNERYGTKSFVIKNEMPVLPEIEKVIFNGPATIVLWADGTKTIVKSQEGEIYDAEKGLAMAIVKKAYGNKGNYFNVIKKWLPKEENDDGDE